MKSYKAFNKGYECLDYKYKDGVNICSGKIKLCDTGFHSCPNPNDLSNYYDVKSEDTVFAIVDVYGETDYNPFDSNKIASKRLKIIKKFDKYEDLLSDFETNGNPTIEYLKEEYRKLNLELNKPKSFDISEEIVKQILSLYKMKETTLARALFVGFMVKLTSNDFNPLSNFTDEIAFITERLMRNPHRVITEFIDKKATYRKLFNMLTSKQKAELTIYVNEFNKIFNTDLETCYKHYLIYYDKPKDEKSKLLKLSKGIQL